MMIRTVASVLGLMTGFPVAADVVEGWVDEARRALSQLWQFAREPLE